MKSYTFLFVSLILMSLVFACGPIGEDSWSDLKPGDSSKDKGGNPHMPQPVDPGGPMLPTPTPTATPTPTPRPTATPTPTPTPTPPPASGQMDVFVDSQIQVSFCTTYDEASRSCGSGSKTAYQSVRAAVSVARAGQTVWVRQGLYAENAEFKTSGQEGAKITLKAYAGEACKTEGMDKLCQVKIAGNLHVASGYDDRNLIPNGVDYIRMEGLEIIADDRVGIDVQGGDYWNYGTVSDHIEIVNNYVHGTVEWTGQTATHGGIETSYVKNLTIEDNKIYNVQGPGITVRGSCDNESCTSAATFRNSDVLIRHNSITHVWCDGIRPSGNNIVIEDNLLGDSTFTDCHQDGLEIYGPVNGIKILNNKIWEWTQNIYISAENADFPNMHIENVEIIGNVVWNNGYSGPGINMGPNHAGIYYVTILNNTFYNLGNTITDSYARASENRITNLIVRNNLFQSPPGIDVQASELEMDHNLNFGSNAGNYFLDPSQRNFHLKQGSPAIDAGMDVGIPFDHDGNPRPIDNAYDVGAYEYQGL